MDQRQRNQRVIVYFDYVLFKMTSLSTIEHQNLKRKPYILSFETKSETFHMSSINLHIIIKK